MEKSKNIYQKLLEIQNQINGLGKDKQAVSYKYVTGDKVLEHIKPMMNNLGLLLKQEIISIENERQDYKVANRYAKGDEPKFRDKSEILSKCMMKFTWVDCETGEKDENMFGANGQNDWDKGVGSALTYAERYFLLKFFHIATDEDDIDNPERKKEEAKELKKAEKKKSSEKTGIEDSKLETLTKLIKDKNKSAIENLVSSRFLTKKQRDLLANVIDKSILDKVEVR